MDIGSKIKEYRINNGLKQKDLAEMLHVSFQAVSRWENNDVEPSLDTIKAMTEIFHCSVDDLMGIEKNTSDERPPEPKPIPVFEPPVVIEKVIHQETRPVLAICHQCNSPIYSANDLRRRHETVTVRNGRAFSHVTNEIILCTKCDERRKEAEKRAEKEKTEQEKENAQKRLIRSIVWGLLSFVLLLAVSIYFYVSKDTKSGTLLLIGAFTSFTFLGCLLLKNNFIPDMWLSIAGWGFVRVPGVIMEFSIGGIIIGILIKIALWIFAYLLGIATVILSTILCMVISPFVYPFAIIKNIKKPSSIND